MHLSQMQRCQRICRLSLCRDRLLILTFRETSKPLAPLKNIPVKVSKVSSKTLFECTNTIVPFISLQFFRMIRAKQTHFGKIPFLFICSCRLLVQALIRSYYRIAGDKAKFDGINKNRILMYGN